VEGTINYLHQKGTTRIVKNLYTERHQLQKGYQPIQTW